MANKKINTKTITMLAILTALVVILQFIPIKGPTFAITLTLVPIVIGSALIGPLAGAWLGFAFGMTVLLSGDAAMFFGFNVFGTIVTVLLKGSLAGLSAGLIYKLASKINRYFGVICSAVVAPVVNTGIFLLGCRVFFFKDILNMAVDSAQKAVAATGNIAQIVVSDVNVFSYMLTALVGINFLIELGVNMVCSPIILRLINIRKKEG